MITTITLYLWSKDFRESDEPAHGIPFSLAMVAISCFLVSAFIDIQIARILANI